MSAQGSRSALAYATEVTYGTSPTLSPPTTNMKYLPFSTHTLDMSKVLIEGQDIRADRMPRHVRHGTREAAGDIVCEFRKADFDPFLESVMMGAWATNVLKTGTTQKFFSIEDQQYDIDQHRLFTGMSVSRMVFDIAPDRMVGCTMSFVGKDMAVSATRYVDTTNPDAYSTNEPMDSFNGALNEGGGALAYATALQFTIENGTQNVKVVGSPTSYEAEYGMARVTGTLTLRYVNATLLQKFIAETASTISIEVDDRTNANPYTFLFPNVKYTGGALPVNTPQGRLITMPFVALYDVAENTNLKITRTNP
jgi:Phage tail tube protein